MGFDNECVPNIQSLAGEYFCPLCRLLVYPNEALQSQCTHLYCKPCLTYIVSTTRACPYDGYLVTEADSKPLIESNKALAETIGKITVHCLYNRSGCTWQGTLTDSMSHCSGCAFGNSPVVCNRCGLQIVHRQVHEHAHTCTGVQAHAQPTVAQNVTATGTAAASDQNQASTQAVAISSQAQTSQTAAITTPGQDLNQKTNTTTQSEMSMPAVTQTAEAWYQQQQQQYQQYYQQYPGYDQYQQHYQQYYPYQQQAIAQYPHSQPQVQMQPQVPQSQPQLQIQPQAQPQVQPQSHPQVQQPVVAQPQNPVQQYMHHSVQPQSQIQSQPQTLHGAPPAQSQLYPLPIHPQPQMAAAQYQQPPLQIQHPQSQFQTQAQTQPNLQVQTQAHAHPQPFVSQPMNPSLQPSLQHPSSHLVTGHQSYPQPQFQPQQQVQTGAVQHPVPMHSHGGQQQQHSVKMQSQLPQQPPLLLPHATTQNLPQPSLLPLPAQAQTHQPVHSHAPGIPANQHHIMQTVQQPMHPQYVQQQQPVFSGPSLGPVQSQAHQQGPYSQLRPQGPPQLMQQPQAYPQQHHGIQTHQAQGMAGKPVMPYPGLGTQPYQQSVVDAHKSAQAGVNHQFGNFPRTNNQLQLSSEQSTVISGPNPERQSDNTSEKGGEGELSNKKNVKQAPDEVDVTSSRQANVVEVKTVKSESDLASVNDQIIPKGDSKDSMESHAAENGELLLKQVKQEPAEVAADQRDMPKLKQLGIYVPENSVKKDIKAEQLDDQNMKLQSGGLMLRSHSVPVVGQGIQQPSAPQQRPVGPPLLQTPPSGYSHHTQFPGHLLTQERPLGPGHTPYLGPALHPQSENLQQPLHKQFHGSENFPGGIGPGCASSFGGVPSEAELFPRLSGPPRIDSSSTFGLPDDKFRPLSDDRINSFPPGPARHMTDQGGIEDLKRFPRPSHFNTEPDPKFASHFSSSQHLDRVPHGFGMNIAPRPLEKGPRAGSLGGVPPSRFFPPYHHDGVLHPNDVGERDTARIHSDYLGPGSGYGRRHLDGLALRSPGRDYTGISSRGFPVHGLDDVDGRDSHRFNDPIGNAFHDSRFPVVAPHLLRGEFDGPGRDGLPSHLPRGENFDPLNLQSHLQLGELPSFAAFPGHSRMGEFPGTGNFRGPRLGEPGFRSSFSQKGFPSDARRYIGNLEFSDNSQKRRPPSMGWCRICKVDCETVEGLDLHSQTREHQKMAMDMVITIKQKAKKQKLASSNHSSVDDGSKSKAASVEASGNKD